jgi:hypothetical protein
VNLPPTYLSTIGVFIIRCAYIQDSTYARYFRKPKSDVLIIWKKFELGLLMESTVESTNRKCPDVKADRWKDQRT